MFAAIMDHFASGQPLVLDSEALAMSDTAIHPEDDEVRMVGREREIHPEDDKVRMVGRERDCYSCQQREHHLRDTRYIQAVRRNYQC